jgi:hypothetical protein
VKICSIRLICGKKRLAVYLFFLFRYSPTPTHNHPLKNSLPAPYHQMLQLDKKFTIKHLLEIKKLLSLPTQKESSSTIIIVKFKSLLERDL